MAGRFVVIEFDDRDAAEVFIENETMAKQLGYRPLALFLRPSKFCQCPDKQRQDVRNWAKGKRSGLYLCTRCKRPSKHHQTGIVERLQYVFGFNQLKVEFEDN